MKIGVFWYYDHQVIGFTNDLAQDHQSTRLNEDHQLQWQKIIHEYPDLKAYDYDYLPRGRAEFDAAHNKLIVYMDTQLFKKSITLQIADFLNVPSTQVSWKRDAMYKTDHVLQVS